MATELASFERTRPLEREQSADSSSGTTLATPVRVHARSTLALALAATACMPEPEPELPVCEVETQSLEPLSGKICAAMSSGLLLRNDGAMVIDRVGPDGSVFEVTQLLGDWPQSVCGELAEDPETGTIFVTLPGFDPDDPHVLGPDTLVRLGPAGELLGSELLEHEGARVAIDSLLFTNGSLWESGVVQFDAIVGEYNVVSGGDVDDIDIRHAALARHDWTGEVDCTASLDHLGLYDVDHLITLDDGRLLLLGNVLGPPQDGHPYPTSEPALTLLSVDAGPWPYTPLPDD